MDNQEKVSEEEIMNLSFFYTLCGVLVFVGQNHLSQSYQKIGKNKRSKEHHLILFMPSPFYTLNVLLVPVSTGFAAPSVVPSDCVAKIRCKLTYHFPGKSNTLVCATKIIP